MPTLTTRTDHGTVNLKDTFGPLDAWEGPQGIPDHVKQKVGKAILTVAAADGTLSEAEMARFRGMAAQFGVPADAFDGFDATQADLDDYLDEETRPVAKVILHDAIKVARADGYGPKEQAAARRAAALLGVPEETLRAIEGLLEVEDALNRARALVVGPN